MRWALVRVAAATALLALALAPAAVALAQSTGQATGTATVSGGTLSLGTVGAVGFSGTLTGLNQVFASSNGIKVTDATGSGNGWNLTIAGTLFTTGGTAPRTLPATALTITSVTAAASDGSTVTPPSNGIPYPLTVPLGASPTAAKFFNAAANTGLGAFDLTAAYNLSIPASTYAGNYTSTLTVSLVAGP